MSAKPTNEEVKANTNLSSQVETTVIPATTEKSNYESMTSPSSLIGKTVCIKGNIAAKEDMLIDGRIEGTLVLKNNKLEIGPSARIEANAVAKIMIISGEVKGDVYASDQVKVTKTGKVFGNIYAADVCIEDGALLKGNIDMDKQDISKHNFFPDFEEDPHSKSASFGLLFKRMREIAHLDAPPIQSEDAFIITKNSSDELLVLNQENPFAGKSLIGEAVMIKGEVIAEEDVVVQGQIDGIVYFKNNSLIVGHNAQIQANIFVKSIVMHGEIKGDVYANDKVVIKRPGHIFGDLHSPRVSIESGAVLMGNIEMEPQNIEKAFADMATANEKAAQKKPKYVAEAVPQPKGAHWPVFDNPRE